MNFPKHAPSQRARSPVISNADVILGMELTDFWADGEFAVSTTASTAIGINQPRMKPDTKLISISSVDLYTKANYQDFQRFQPVDIAMAADAEATLPALIEAVKAAIPNDRKAAIEKRGEAAKKADAEARERTRRRRRSPGTQARSAPRGCRWRSGRQIKNLDWSLVAQSGNVSNWPHRLWTMEKHHHWLGHSGGYGLGYGARPRSARRWPTAISAASRCRSRATAT